jgi:hypothetical protein
MELRIGQGTVVLAGILAALAGGDYLPGLVAVVTYIGVVALARSAEERWFLHLCAGCFVAVAAGLSSPVWAVIVMLPVLACAGAELDLFPTQHETRAHLVFSVVLILLAVPLTGMRHAALPLAALTLIVLAGAGFVAVAWARTVWKARVGDL